MLRPSAFYVRVPSLGVGFFLQTTGGCSPAFWVLSVELEHAWDSTGQPGEVRKSYLVDNTWHGTPVATASSKR